MSDLDLAELERLAEARVATNGFAYVLPEAVADAKVALRLIAALRAERARTERLQVALNFAGTWMATDLSPEGTQAYADFLALAETKELP